MLNYILLAVIYLAFISLGLPDGVFGVAWPSMRVDFGIPLQSAGIVTTLLMWCSAVSGFMSGKVLRRFGTAKVTFFSTLLTGLALLGYSITPSFLLLIAFAIPLGFGQGAVDSGLNNYVANNYTSRHMSWLHCFWGVGATLGPLIMTKTIASNLSWRNGYGRIATIQLFLAFVLLISLKLWKKETPEITEGNVSETASETKAKKSVLNSMAPWIAVMLFFVYVGIEYSVGLWTNSLLVECRHIAKETAGLWISYYYGSLMAGRFLTGIIVNRIGNRTLIRIGIIIAVSGAFLVFINAAQIITMIGLILIGLGLAPIYPCMMHETPKRFDEATSSALIGYQVGAACLGGSIITSGLGLIFSISTLEILLPCVGLLLLAMFIMTEYLNKTT